MPWKPLDWAVKCFTEVDSPAHPSGTDRQTHCWTRCWTHHQTHRWTHRRTPSIHNPSWSQSIWRYTHLYTIRADCNQFNNNANQYTILANCNCRHHAHPSVYRPPCHLCRLEGCSNPLITLWLITAITILFFSIHTIARAYSNVKLRFWQCQI